MGYTDYDSFLLAVALLWLLAVSNLRIHYCEIFYDSASLLTFNLFLLFRADSLEEVVGLDVGYTGGELHKRLHAQDSDEDKNYSAYLDEYVHRRRERAFKRNDRGGIPASSIHSPSLHGSSYHGRKLITPAMREDALGNSSSRASVKSNNSGNLKRVASNGEDWTDNDKAAMDTSRNSGVPSLPSVRESVKESVKEENV